MAAAAVESMPGLERHVDDDLPVPAGIGANQGVIKDEHIERLRPTPKDTPIDEIRRRLKEDGYIFMKGLIPREDVLNLRKQYDLPLLLPALERHATPRARNLAAGRHLQRLGEPSAPRRHRGRRPPAQREGGGNANQLAPPGQLPALPRQPGPAPDGAQHHGLGEGDPPPTHDAKA
ncbi:hypothetical protein V494_01683 [Pseudogymnoascus sp. VKM F-4513 (FW-928)]|nr:hypothetical protein V494_01683 [Pseudogymnoascus sp. VKM F-4513 (FW-928)]